MTSLVIATACLSLLAAEDGLTLRGHDGWIACVACSPDGKRIVSGSADDTLKVWGASDGKVLRTIDPDNEYDVTAVALSPDSQRIASGDGENNVRVWEANTSRELFTLFGHDGAV